MTIPGDIFASLRWSWPALACTSVRRDGRGAALRRGRAARPRRRSRCSTSGQGDSILIRSPEGKTALIDAGPTTECRARRPQAQGHHVARPGGDQPSSQRPLRRDGRSGEGHEAALLPGEPLGAHDVALPEAAQDGAGPGRSPSSSRSSRPRKIELGSVELTIFPQPPEDRKEENNNSIGLRLKYGSFSVLLTGDSEGPERQWWLEHDPELVRDCTILKLAHHGSRNGTDARWLQAVRPELAVASMGRNNEFGHPHSETVSLLRRSRIPLLRTDQLGTITITSDGRSWQVTRPALARAGRPTQADVDRVAAASEDARQTTRSRAR